MTKIKIIGITAGAVIIAALIALAIYFSGLSEIKHKDVNNDLGLNHSLENQVIFKGDITKIDYIEIKNQYGDYKVRQNENGKIVIVGREQAPLLHYSSSALYSSVKSVKCDALIERNSQRLAEFGLEEPAATVTVMTLDSKATTFHIGNKAPLGDGYYICMDGSSDIYIVNTFYAERYLSEFVSLYDTKISKFFEYSGFNTLDISPAAGAAEINIRTTSEDEKKKIEFATGLIMEKPFFNGADDNTVKAAVEKLANLKAKQVATDEFLNDELKKKYGFENPVTIKITMNVDTSSYALATGEQNPYYKATEDGSPLLVSSTYYLGNTDGDNIYVMYDESPVIYICSASDFAFASADVYQYCQRIVNIKYLNELKGLKAETGGKTYSFSIQDPDAGDEMIVTYDYRDIRPSNFRDFYINLVGITHNGIGEEPDGDVLLRITYEGADGNDSVLEFITYPDDPGMTFFSVDGEGHFKILTSKVEKIINDINKLINGEAILS